MEKLKKNYIIQAWLVLLLTIFFGSSLAVVQLVLSPKIQANKINETLQRIPELIAKPLPANAKNGMGKIAIRQQTVEVKKNNRKKVYCVYKVLSDGQPGGWVVKSSGQGYADKIELLIGFDPLIQKITGLFVLEQKETPGLGNKIVESGWRNQFVQKTTTGDIIAVKKKASAPNEIDALTGATISSRSVCAIINTVITDLKPILPTSNPINQTGKP